MRKLSTFVHSNFVLDIFLRGVGMNVSSTGVQRNATTMLMSSTFCFRHQSVSLIFQSQLGGNIHLVWQRHLLSWRLYLGPVLSRAYQLRKSSPISHIQQCLPPHLEHQLVPTARMTERHVRTLFADISELVCPEFPKKSSKTAL